MNRERAVRRLRTVLALALVAGYYLLAVALAVGYSALGALLARVFEPGLVAFGLDEQFPFLLLIQGGFGIAAAVKLADILAGSGAAAKGPWSGTVALTWDDAPRLWELVTELVERTGAPFPAEIRLAPQANAAISETGRLGGHRVHRLYLGLPLLGGLRVDEVRAVLCHELGHCAGGHTRFVATVYRGAAALGAARRGYARFTPGNNPVDAVLSGVLHLTVEAYAWLYNVMTFSVRRRLELEADATAAAIAGKAAMAQALTCADGLVDGWGRFQARHLSPMARLGYYPDDLVRAFAEVAQTPLHDGTARRRAAEQSLSRRSPFDSHPPLGQRLMALDRLAADTADLDPRPAHVLIDDGHGIPDRAWAVMLPAGPPEWPRTTMLWQDWLAASAGLEAARAVQGLAAAVEQVTHGPASLADVLDLLGAGRGPELAAALDERAWSAPGWSALDQPRLPTALGVLLGHQLATAGRARWRAVWAGPAEIDPADDDAAAVLAMAGPVSCDPHRVIALRAGLARCRVGLEHPLVATTPAGTDPGGAPVPASAPILRAAADGGGELAEATGGGGSEQDPGAGRAEGGRQGFRPWLFVVSAITLLLLYGNYRLVNNPVQHHVVDLPYRSSVPVSPTSGGTDPVPGASASPSAAADRPDRPPMRCVLVPSPGGWGPVARSSFPRRSATIEEAAVLLQTDAQTVLTRGVVGPAECRSSSIRFEDVPDLEKLAPVSVLGIPGADNCVPFQLLVRSEASYPRLHMLCVLG